MNVQQYPKPSHERRKRAKNNPMPTAEDFCIYCGTPYAQTHEVFEGTGRRQLSIIHKLQVKVCNDCHRDIQTHPLSGRDLALKKEYQQKFIDQYGYERWMKEFQRDYSEM